MTIGGALVLIALGAILKWAVTAHVNGFDVQTAGTVLFVVGLAGLFVALVYSFWWAQRDRVVDDTRVMRPRSGPPPA
jgi:hypothetical protein